MENATPVTSKWHTKKSTRLTWIGKAKKYTGINIKWDYVPVYKNRKAHLLMKDQIKDLISKEVHTKPIKVQILPHLHIPIVYGSTKKFTAETDKSDPLDAKGILCVQNNVGALLYYGCAVNNK